MAAGAHQDHTAHQRVELSVMNLAREHHRRRHGLCAMSQGKVCNARLIMIQLMSPRRLD